MVSDLLHFEDFHPGRTFALGPRAITAEEIVAFAREYDPQPFHLDDAAAKQTILGGLSASGWHTCALGMRMMVDGLFSRSTSLGSPGVEEVRWIKPVRPGDVLRMEGTVLDARPSSSRPDRGLVRLRFEMFNQREKVASFICLVLFGRRESAP